MKAIAAMSRHGRVIGLHGKTPWHLPEELRWFKQTTSGAAVLMGRKTFTAIGRPLPGRLNLVVSRHPPPGAARSGVEWVRDLDAFRPADYTPREVWVIGGAEIFAQTLPRCDEVYLSLVEQEVEGDAFFPEFEADFPQVETLWRRPEFEVRRYRRTRGMPPAGDDPRLGLISPG